LACFLKDGTEEAAIASVLYSYAMLFIINKVMDGYFCFESPGLHQRVEVFVMLGHTKFKASRSKTSSRTS
jgi:hypothetical protein